LEVEELVFKFSDELGPEKANDEGVMPRVAAEKIAKERVLNAMKYRGWL